MALTEQQIYEEALRLPDESKVLLAERIIEYVETHVDRGLERKHLDIAKKRRDEMRSGKVRPVDGEEALARVRRLINT